MKKLIRSYPILAIAVAALVGALVVGAIWAAVGGRPQPTPPGAAPTESATPTPEPSATDKPQPSATPSRPAIPDAKCAAATITVASADALTNALSSASPGDVIELAPGEYVGNFITQKSGTPEQPIALCGTADSVLNGDGDNYVFHLDGAQYWRLSGFAVTNGQKGVMADTTIGSVIQGLTVHSIGDEAIHLRRASTDNIVVGNTISNTGLRKEKFGEGIYIGTAESNWCDISDCEPDLSDRNLIEGNFISGTTAENIDVKEGTSNGIIRGNSFDGAKMSAADSWVDIKGNDWIIEGNTGTNSPGDGFQTHEILDGWGTSNVFRDNVAEVNGPGFGFALTPKLANTVDCNNKAPGAGEGLTNTSCTG